MRATSCLRTERESYQPEWVQVYISRCWRQSIRHMAWMLKCRLAHCCSHLDPNFLVVMGGGCLAKFDHQREWKIRLGIRL